MENFFERARQLLQPLMGEDRRDIWLTLAFHGQQRAIYDAIPQDGATTVFTVRCVRYLLDRGCVGSRHALSLLLESVRGDAGDQLQESFHSLIDELDRQCTSIRTAQPGDADKGTQPSPCAAQTAGDAGSSVALGATTVPLLPARPVQPPFPAATAVKRDFFISYNRHDQGWAEWIAWQLEDAGYTTVIQAWDFHAGDNFVDKMDRAAQGSRRTIAVLSNDYLAAKFTTAEWTAAFARDPSGGVLPVRVRACQPEGQLRTIVYVDLLGLDEPTAKQTLLARIRGDRLKPSRSPGFPGQGAAPGFPSRSEGDAIAADLLAVRRHLLDG